MIKKNLKDLIVEYIYSIVTNQCVTICYLNENELARNCQNMGHSDFLVSLFYQGSDSKKRQSTVLMRSHQTQEATE